MHVAGDEPDVLLGEVLEGVSPAEEVLGLEEVEAGLGHELRDDLVYNDVIRLRWDDEGLHNLLQGPTTDYHGLQGVVAVHRDDNALRLLPYFMAAPAYPLEESRHLPGGVVLDN